MPCPQPWKGRKMEAQRFSAGYQEPNEAEPQRGRYSRHSLATPTTEVGLGASKTNEEYCRALRSSGG